VDPFDGPRPRWGWLAIAALGSLITLATVVGGLWALAITVDSGTGSPFQVLVGVAGASLFWGWMTGGAWRRARDPEPDPLEPSPLPRRAAFVAANVVLAVMVTALVAFGLWFEITSAQDRARIDQLRTRIEVAARRADLTVEKVDHLRQERQFWMMAVTSGREDAADPIKAVLAVDGAAVADIAVEDGRAAILFVPDAGPPCVRLDIDELDIITTSQVTRC
jgi:hypothetical protein